MLRAADDQDVVRSADHAAPAREVLRDRPPQRRQARRVRIVRASASRGRDELARPGAHQIEADPRSAVVEIVAWRAGLGTERAGAQFTDSLGVAGLRRKGCRGRHQPPGPLELRDLCAGPIIRDGQPLGPEDLVRGQDGVARQTEHAGQSTACRQSLAGRKMSRHDRALQNTCELFVESPLTVEWKQ